MLMCILDMLSDATFRPGTHGISAKSFITCIELRKLYVYGSGMFVFSVFVNISARL
jgi:hypothetical protein